MTAVCQAVQSRSRESFTAEYLSPVLEWQIGRDNQALTFVGRTDHVEQQFRPNLAGWHVPKFIQNQHVEFRELFAKSQQHTFFPLGKLVFASRVQTGFVFGPDDLLASDAFRAGGATTVRGYGEDSLGPRDAQGIPKGGETLVILNQEARFPIYRWVHGVAFVDAGHIFGKGEKFSWGDLNVGYGIGLRFDTPVGMFRVDIGIPTTALTTTRSATRVHFGFGHIF